MTKIFMLEILMVVGDVDSRVHAEHFRGLSIVARDDGASAGERVTRHFVDERDLQETGLGDELHLCGEAGDADVRESSAIAPSEQMSLA
jgi:hypothetical protein